MSCWSWWTSLVLTRMLEGQFLYTCYIFSTSDHSQATRSSWRHARRHFSVTYSRCSNINDEPTQCLQAIQSENVLNAVTASCLAGTTQCPLKSRIRADTRQFVFGLLNNDFSKLYYAASHDRWLVNRLTLKNPGGWGVGGKRWRPIWSTVMVFAKGD